MIQLFTSQKKSLADSGLFNGFTDHHSHILPGVDDGIPSMQKARETLDYYETLGIAHIVLTPHVMEDYPQNNPDFLTQQFEKLKANYQGPLQITLGAEYMLDPAFQHHIDTGKLLPIAGNLLLVETSCFDKPCNLIRQFAQIHDKGYHILLAHPERYLYMSLKEYRELKENNIHLQLNLLSLTGAYGNVAEIKANELLRKEYYDAIGSDLHNLACFQHEITRKKISSETLKRLNALKEKS